MHHPIGLFLYDRPAVILVLVYLYFPFAALTLYASIERFDWDQLRAAMDLGARPLTAIRRILVPQIKPGLVTAVIFVFIPVLGEYLTPQIVGGTRGVMIGNLVVNFFQADEYTRGAAISLLIAAVHRPDADRVPEVARGTRGLWSVTSRSCRRATASHASR